MTEKGDLLVRYTTYVGRLPSGTNGQVLTVDTSEPAGVAWQNPDLTDIEFSNLSDIDATGATSDGQLYGLEYDSTTGGYSLETVEPTTIGPGLTSLENLTDLGVVVQTSDNNFAARTLAAGSGLAWTNSQGIAGSPVIALDIPSMTEDASPDATADFIQIYDASADGYKKVKLQNLPFSGGSPSSNIFINVKDTGYAAVGDGIADDTAAIQAALDDAFDAGGGVVYMPPGVYGVVGTGDASDGGLRIRDNTTLMGAGMGASTIKLLAAQGTDDITGIVRTPSGEPTRKVNFYNFTIDGNRSSVTSRVIGWYIGVDPSEAITVSVSGTTATATTVSGDHNLTTGQTYYIKNGENAGLTGDFVITSTSDTTFTFTVASGTASDAVGYTWFYPSGSFANIADEDIYVENVEVKDCQAYGFDPHECARRLRMVGCVAHGMGPDGDGFTLDGIFDSTLENCYAYNNARNGINLVTGTSNVTVLGCHTWSNGQYGMADQRGSTLIPRNRDNSFVNCVSRNNTRNGIRVQMSYNTNIQGCHFHDNGREGILLEGCSYNIVSNNQVHSNSQTTNNVYNEIYVKEYVFSADSATYASTYNSIDNNNLNAPLAKKSKYLIQEANDSSNYNSWRYNKLATPGATGSTSIPVGNPNSVLIEDSTGSGSGGTNDLYYFSTMSTSGTATANTVALLADIAAASTARKVLYIPAGSYSFGYDDGTTMTVPLTDGGTNFCVIRGAPGGLTTIKTQSGDYRSFLNLSCMAGVTDYAVSAVATATSGANLSTTSEVTSLTLSSPPASMDKGEMVSVFSDDLLPQRESTSERNYQHFFSEVYNLTSSTLLLGRKLPRTFTTDYCRLRRYNNSTVIVDIDDITFEADGDPSDTGLGNSERPSYFFAIEGVRDPVIGPGVRFNNAWAGTCRFSSTMGAIFRGYTKKILNGVTGEVVLGYAPAFDGANFNPRIESTVTYNGRHTPTTTFAEQGIFTITGATVGASNTVLDYSNADATPAIGDRIEISGIVGTLSALNGTKHTITARTGNTTSGTVTFAYNSSGLAYTSGGTANHWQPEVAYRSGEVEGLEVHGSAVIFSQGAAFDSHANSLKSRYRNCSVRFPYTLTEGSVTPTGFSFRGCGESVDNFYGERLTRLVALTSFSLQYGLDNICEFNNLHLHDQQRGISGTPVAYFVPLGSGSVTDVRKIRVNGIKFTGGTYRVLSVPANSCDVEFNAISYTGDWGKSGGTHFMFDFASSGKVLEITNSIFDFRNVSTDTQLRILSLTNGSAIFKNCTFKGLGGTTSYPFSVSSSGTGIKFINCDFELLSSATDNTVLLCRNQTTATIDFINCRIINGAKLKSTTGLIYSNGGTPVTTTTVANLESDSLNVRIIGSSSTAGTFTVNRYVPTKTYSALGATSSGSFVLPANTRIDAISMIGTNANAVTGGIKIGTTAGGTDIVAAQAVGGNSIVSVADADILKRIFSTSATQTIYFDAVTAWNSANVNLYFKFSEL